MRTASDFPATLPPAKRIIPDQNFAAIHKDVERLARSKRVFWGSGDWLRTAAPLLYHENPADGITYFATYLADSGSDLALKIEVGGDTAPQFTAIALANFEPVDLSRFTVLGKDDVKGH